MLAYLHFPNKYAMMLVFQEEHDLYIPRCIQTSKPLEL